MKRTLFVALLWAIPVLSGVGLVGLLGAERRIVSESGISTRVSYWDALWRAAENPPPIQLGKDLLPPTIPGPRDVREGQKPHTLTVTFDADPGRYRLVLLSYEAHESRPPRLSFALNGEHLAEVQVVAGAGRRRPYEAINYGLTVRIPLVTTSTHNTLVITSIDGSWVAPAGARLVAGLRFNPGKAAYLLLARARYGAALGALLLASIFFWVLPRNGSREALLTVGIVLASTLVGLVLSEMAFREWLIRNPAQRALRTPAGRPPSEQEEGYTFLSLVQPSSEPEIPYEMKPHLDGDFLGQRMQTNADGLRGPELPVAKPPGTVRIVGLGDSVVLGWGVGYDDAALTKIGRLVEARVGRPTETVNTGVPSYNTANEVATYRRKGRLYHPDVVVLIFLDNDFGFPSLMLAPVERLTLRTSYLREQIRRGLVQYWPEAAQYEQVEFISSRRLDELWAKKAGQPLTDRERWLQRVEAHYRAMSGFDAVKASLTDLGNMLREDGAIGVLVYDPVNMTVGHPGSYEKNAGWVVKTAREAGLEAIDMTPVFEAYLKERGLQRIQDGLWLTPTDWHPNVAGHDLIAHAVIDVLERTGNLTRLKGR